VKYVDEITVSDLARYIEQAVKEMPIRGGYARMDTDYDGEFESVTFVKFCDADTHEELFVFRLTID
jgi:hypothetical protein